MVTQTKTEVGFEAHTTEEFMRGFGAERIPDYYRVATEHVNAVTQTRPDRNPRQAALDRSFELEGQLEPGLATIVGPEVLQEYLDFVNNTWGSEHTIDEMSPMPGNGHYLLLMAGHSRLISAINTGKDYDVRIMQADSVDQILSIQRNENIHSEPPEHRTARAIAELFLWNKKKFEEAGGKYTKAQFLEEHSYTESALDKAMAYIRLPGYIRELVNNDAIHFSVAAEIGKAQRRLREAYPRLYFPDEVDVGLDEESIEQIENYIDIKLYSFATKYLESKRVAATNSHIRAYVKAVQLKADEQCAPDVAQLMQIEDARTLEDDITIARNELTKTITEFETLRAQRAAELARNSAEATQHVLALEMGEEVVSIVEQADQVVDEAQALGNRTIQLLLTS